MKTTITCVAALSSLWLAPASLLSQTSTLQDLAGQLAAEPDRPTIYVAQDIITIDPKQPHARAVAVKDGRFMAVGTLADVKSMAGPEAKVDETFANKVVVAGFVEQHVHPVLAALTMNTKVISIEDWDTIDGFSAAVRDPKGYEARLLKALSEHKDKTKPFITWGYHHYMHGDQMSRAYLNQVAPDFPVIVWHRSCHEFFFNDAALKLAGIDKAFFDKMPKSAQEQACWEKGHFFEQGALAILGKIAPIMASKEQFRKGLEYTESYYHRNGITVACEPGGFPSKAIQDAINAVYSDDATPFNHYFMADGKSLAAANLHRPEQMLAESEKVLSWGRGRTRYLPKQVKLLTDGAIYSQLMMMKDGYTDGHKGAWIMDPPVLGYAFQTYWDAGYQIHIHNNGDGGLDILLGELEKAMARNPRKDHRTVLVHFGFARPEQVEKWIKLGGIVSANPYYVTALAGPYATLGLTPQWADNMVPLGDVLKHGGSLSFHSDMPMAPAKPMQLIWAAVNRTTYEGKVAGLRHKVPLDVALRAMTLDAAYSIQLEKEIGSIEVGKLANLTVLEQSPYEVAPEKLKNIVVVATVLEGRIQPVPAAPKTASASRVPDGLVDPCLLASEHGRAGKASHSQADGDCCSCSMNRAFGVAMAAIAR